MTDNEDAGTRFFRLRAEAADRAFEVAAEDLRGGLTDEKVLERYGLDLSSELPEFVSDTAWLHADVEQPAVADLERVVAAQQSSDEARESRRAVMSNQEVIEVFGIDLSRARRYDSKGRQVPRDS